MSIGVCELLKNVVNVRKITSDLLMVNTKQRAAGVMSFSVESQEDD